MGDSVAAWLDARIDALREHLIALIHAVPGLPGAFARVQEALMQEWQARGPGTVAGLIVGFIGLGFIVEALYRRFVPRSEAQRLRLIALELARELGALAVFTIGSTALFLSFDWPPRTRQAVLAALTAFVLFRATLIVSRALFAPGDDRLRIVPVEDPYFVHARLTLFAAWLAAGWLTLTWLALLGMDLPSRQLIAYALGLGLLVIAMEAVWRSSRVAALGFLVAWAFWVLRAPGLFWLVVVAVTLPAILRHIQAGADHVLSAGTRTVLAAAVGRGLRALAIVGAAWLVLQAFALNVEMLTAQDTMAMRVVRGLVQALAVVLLADVLWLVVAALIDQKLNASDEANARLRTLLPIVRGSVAGLLIIVTVLMVVSSLGIEVGPLMASAGVLGIALGFGAQTLVRDLLSKFFYLFDDAFRIGEYIQSGTYKGTVEHLGARSIRLRHHRGPVYTIPYGQLGAVQNMSRDWVIDKMELGLTYDADLEKARKLIKKIGQSLAEDPEFKPQIIEPLKMQGVENFGDFAIKVRMKMTTKPGEQFRIRRKAFAMIKKAFDENGIHFAFPTVQVAGGGAPAEASAVAAVRQGLELQQKTQT
jgi:small-conductance mechanosensitive channel